MLILLLRFATEEVDSKLRDKSASLVTDEGKEISRKVRVMRTI